MVHVNMYTVTSAIWEQKIVLFCLFKSNTTDAIVIKIAVNSFLNLFYNLMNLHEK